MEVMEESPFFEDDEVMELHDPSHQYAATICRCVRDRRGWDVLIEREGSGVKLWISPAKVFHKVGTEMLIEPDGEVGKVVGYEYNPTYRDWQYLIDVMGGEYPVRRASYEAVKKRVEETS